MVKDHSDSERKSLCYSIYGTLVGKRNSSMGPSREVDPMTHHTVSGCSITELCLASYMSKTVSLKIDLVSSNLLLVKFTDI